MERPESLDKKWPIIDRRLRNQNDKLDGIFVVVIIIFMSFMLIWGYNVYIKINDVNIINIYDDLEVDNLDLNYLIEQNHYKQLSTTEKKEQYKLLSNKEKMTAIKKQLIADILKV